MRPTRALSLGGFAHLATPAPPYLANATPVRYPATDTECRPIPLASRRCPPATNQHTDNVSRPFIGRMSCKFLHPCKSALPGLPLPAPQRPAAGHHRDAAPAQRPPSASTCAPARATRRRETNGLSHFLEHMLFRGSARYPELVRAEPRHRGAGRHALRRDRARLLALPDHAAPAAAGARAGDPGRSVQRAGVPRHRPRAADHPRGDPRGPRRSRPQRQRRRPVAHSWPGATHPLGYPDHRAAAQRAALLATPTCARTSGASTAPPTWCWRGRAAPARTRVARQAARGLRAACRAARGAAPLAPRPAGPRAALPRRAQRVGADAGAHPVSRAARDRSRTTWRCARWCACSTTACRRGCTTRSAIRRGWPTRSPGIAALVPRRRAAGDRRRLRARQAAGAGRRGAGDARRGSATSWSARTSSTRPSAASSATSRPATTISTACAAGSAAPSSTRAPTRRRSGPARWRACGPRDIRDVARRVIRPERLSVTSVGALSPALVAQGREDRARASSEAALDEARSRCATCVLASSASWRRRRAAAA